MHFSTTIVQQSWQQVVPVREQAAALFYTRLFELDPSLRPFFRAGIEERGRDWGAMMSVAVANLERPLILLPMLYALGAQLEKTGVHNHDYDVVGEALIDALRRVLGDAFTPEIRAAWADAYAVVANVLKTAGADFNTLAA